eukprot:scaffold2636_cov340-Pavlova_lutheri.AAC.23
MQVETSLFRLESVRHTPGRMCSVHVHQIQCLVNQRRYSDGTQVDIRPTLLHALAEQQVLVARLDAQSLRPGHARVKPEQRLQQLRDVGVYFGECQPLPQLMYTCLNLLVRIDQVPLCYGAPGDPFLCGFPEKHLVRSMELPWILVGRPSNHDPAQLGSVQVLLGIFQRSDSSIDAEFQVREVLAQPVHHIVTKRGYAAVGLGSNAIEQGFTRVYGEVLDPAGRDRGNEFAQVLVRVQVVHANPALDRHGNVDGFDHASAYFRDVVWSPHQRRAEAAGTHTFAGTPAVEVDGVVSLLLAQHGRLGQRFRIRTAELHRDGMLFGVERQQLVSSVERGAGHDHLGVQPGPLGQQAHHAAEGTRGDFHHRRDGYGTGVVLAFRHHRHWFRRNWYLKARPRAPPQHVVCTIEAGLEGPETHGQQVKNGRKIRENLRRPCHRRRCTRSTSSTSQKVRSPPAVDLSRTSRPPPVLKAAPSSAKRRRDGPSFAATSSS